MQSVETHLRLSLFGSPTQSLGGQSVTGFRSAKTQALLYYLAAAGGTHSRASLAALFWPDVGESKARNSLRNALSSLRSLIPDHVQIERQSASLPGGRVWVDTRQVTQLLQETDDPTLMVQQHQAAVSLYTGNFIEGFSVADAPEFEQWLTTQREYFHGRMVNTLMGLARWYDSQGDATASQVTLARLLSMAPGNEAAHRLMMVVLSKSGQREAAIQQFTLLRHYLADELGVDPEPESAALYEQLLNGTEPDPSYGPRAATFPHSPPANLPNPLHRSESKIVYVPHTQDDFARIDWGDMPGRTPFYGRAACLDQLTDWLLRDRATLVTVSGMGGVGKTALAAELVHQLAERAPSENGYEQIIWRSLINAPALETLLDDWLQILIHLPRERLPAELDGKLNLLFPQLQKRRILLVLDNGESILDSGDQVSSFRTGFSAYSQLLARMAHGHHQSCLLVTSRIMPASTHRLALDYDHVRHMPLPGLSPQQGASLLRARRIQGATSALHTLVAHYSGNPLALKLVASAVSDLYSGDLGQFLNDGIPIFEDVRSVLEQQFERLSPLAQDLLFCLTIQRQPVDHETLRADLVEPPTQREYLEAIRSIRHSSLLQEVGANEAGLNESRQARGRGAQGRIALQNVVMEYLSDRLFNVVQADLQVERLETLHRYGLCKADALEYIQAAQKRLLLQPLHTWLVQVDGLAGTRQRLRRLLQSARQDTRLARGYAGANLLHLMLQHDADLSGEDFSGLALRQADLRPATMNDVNLQNSDLSTARFLDSFGIVAAVAVSPDGRFVAAGAGSTVVVWTLQSLRPYMVFEGHKRVISDIGFAPDGTHLVSASYDGSVFLWDLPAGKRVAQWRAQVGDLLTIAFSPDGETLAGGGYNGLIDLWRWRTGERIGTLAPTERVLRLAFAPSGELLATVGYHGKIQAWDIASQQVLYTLWDEHPTMVTHAALAVGRTMLWAHQGAVIHGWDRAQRAISHRLSHSQSWIDSLALSPDERQIASADANGLITLWDLSTHQPLRFLEGHKGSVRSLTYTPDGCYVVSGGYDETVRIWNTRDGLEERRLQGRSRWIYRLAFSPDGETLAGVTLTGAIYFWNAADLRPLHTFQGHTSAIRAFAFSPDSQCFATGSDDGTVAIWDVPSGALLYRLPNHGAYVRTVAFDVSGERLVSSGFDHAVRIWDVATGRQITTIPLQAAATMDNMSTHPHQALLAYGDADDYVHIWDLDADQEILRTPVPGPSKVLAYSPDGAHLACSTYDGTILLWGVVCEDSGTRLVERWRVQPSTECAWRIVFAADSSLLAWNGQQKEIYVASVSGGESSGESGGEVLYTVPGTHLANCIAFSADGKHLLTDGDNFGVYVVDASSGNAVTTLAGHSARPSSIVVNPVTSLVASSDNAGTVTLWETKTGTAQANALLNGPYLGMKIAGATGLTQGQRQALRALGAVTDTCR